MGEQAAAARRFAFIRAGEFSHTNQQVLRQLLTRFPQLEADVVELDELRIVRAIDIPALIGSIAHEFGLPACAGIESFRRHCGRTAYLFERTREVLLRRLAGGDYAFTFQTQSLFDGSRPGTPHFIYTDHTHLENLKYPVPAATTPISRGWARLERGAYHHASMIFTMSDNISRSLIEEYGCPPGKVACVHAGSNVTIAASERIDEGRFSRRNILFVGVDWERKGGPVLLEAFRLLRRSYPDARLTIVGCSPAVSEPGVHVVGRVPLAEVGNFYRAAAVFCLPTLNEPFGLVFLEAFAYGVPVVATNLGAIPEIVSEGQSGYLVRPQDPLEVADRLGRLLGDPDRCARFGAYGREWVSRGYTWEETGRRIAAHIEQITAPAGNPAQPPVPGARPMLAV